MGDHGILVLKKLSKFRKQHEATIRLLKELGLTCQTQNYLRIVQRYLRMVENFAMLHYSLLQRAPPENHCVLTQLRWPLRSNCCPAVQFDGGAVCRFSRNVRNRVEE